jgi:hypothetical protein
MSLATQLDDVTGPPSTPPPPIEPADGDAAEKRLVEEIARGPDTVVDDPSNYVAMCEAAFRERQFSRPCPSCKGLGSRNVHPKRLKQQNRQLAKARDPAELANLRKKFREESTCHVCAGTGFREAPDRRTGVQRTLCDDCRGVGELGGDTCPTCRGVGDVCLGRLVWWVTASCPRCQGSGEFFDEDAEDVCPLCKGEAANVPITVFPKGSSKHGFGPDVGAMPADTRTAAGKALDPAEQRDTAILDAFERVREVRPDLASTLAKYRGPLGNRWGHGHPYGRGFVLWTDVPSGKAVLARAPEHLRREYGARPLELLAVMRDHEDRAKSKNMLLGALFTRADREVRVLIDEARRALGEAAR